MRAIIKTELKIYFRSISTWAFMAAMLFFMGLYVSYYNLSGGSPYAAYAISSVLLFVMLLLPILTMKSWAGERKTKAELMLFSAPVSRKRIVFGKYLAMEVVWLIATLIFGAYLLIPTTYGSIPFLENLTALFGFFLFGSAGLSMGLFFAVIVKNQLIAAVVTYAVLMFCTFMLSITGWLLPAENSVSTALNEALDITAALNSLLNGVCNLRSVLYYLTVIAIMLTLTCLWMQKRQQRLAGTLKNRVLFYGKIIGALAMGIAVNLLAGLLPDAVVQFDVTKEQMYALTDTTKEILSELDEDITIYVMAGQEDADHALGMILGRYEAQSSHIRVSYKNPAVFPNFAEFYTSQELAENSLIVVGQERVRVIPYDDLYEVTTSINYETYDYYQTVTGFDGEGQITGALTYVTSETIPIVYVLRGHEEYDLPDQLINEFAKRSLQTESLNLAEEEEIPQDAEAIILCGPLSDYAKAELDTIRSYLDTGGHAMFFVGFSSESTQLYEDFFGDYGIEVAEGVVFEEDEGYFYESPFYLLPDVLDTDLTAELYADSRVLLMAQCRGLTIQENYDRERLTITPLLQTSGTAYSKVDVINAEVAEKEDLDIDGPFYLALGIEQACQNGQTSKMVVVGTEYLVDADLNTYSSEANYTFVLSALDTLTGQQIVESVPVKKYELSTIEIPEGVANTVSIILTFVVPVLLFACGMILWLKRRKR